MAKATEKYKPIALKMLSQNPPPSVREVAAKLGDDIHHTTVWRWWVKEQQKQGAIG